MYKIDYDNLFDEINSGNSKFQVSIQNPYDENFGDDRICKCGHPYYRHFDSYDDMKPIGCKYCACFIFDGAES